MIKKDLFRFILAFATLVTLIAMGYFLFTKDLPTNNVSLISLVLGYLAASHKDIINYIFPNTHPVPPLKDDQVRKKDE